jgi:hypothetical protein
MNLTQVRLTLRVLAMILLGVVPATLLTIFLVFLLTFGGSVPSGVDAWLVVMVILGISGVIGLWGATFQNDEDRAIPPRATVALLLCGLLGAAPVLMDLMPSTLEDGDLSVWLVIFLFGPIGCAVYFLVERVIVVFVKRRRASNSSLEGDASKATRASG